MRWIADKGKFDSVASDAKLAVRTDEGEANEEMERLVFDSAELCTRNFFELLRSLMKWSGDAIIYYLVLTPDPVNYFLAHFGKYPLLEIRSEDSTEGYLAALNDDPGGSPADAVGINWSQYAILPSSNTWYIRGLRDDRNDEGGHLWVPRGWKAKVIEVYPSASGL